LFWKIGFWEVLVCEKEGKRESLQGKRGRNIPVETQTAKKRGKVSNIRKEGRGGGGRRAWGGERIEYYRLRG